ncbi:aryl-alcohol-oxidase from pleurotus Eryingii [Mycena amicta]|nr:aryl-alcohol-oxidase from pleurotus Eryingii [Mycena amicta]
MLMQLPMHVLLSVFVYALCVHAAIWETVADLEKLNTKFDFIVVGGGTAGNVVANRLSENPTHSVLVLEAGGSNAGILAIEAPLLCITATPDTAQDWNYTTTPQVGLNNRPIAYPRGHVLGGSSSVNYLIYTRGSKEDFDRFARVANDQRWSWDALIPYILKNEIFTPPVDHHNTAGQFNPLVHGFSGINSVTLNGFPTEIDSKVIQTTKTDSEFPFNLDMNSGFPLGVGWTQMTALNGARSSSATSYLAPKFVARPNLQGAKAFAGKTFSLTANNEVILSAGSVNTPNILLHSGIGNSSTLTALGIKPLHNLPSVGQNLTDHALLPMAWTVNSINGTFDPIFQNPAATVAAIQQWNTTRTGRLVDDIIAQIGWLRVPNNSSIFKSFPDPAAGPNTAHYELLFSNGYAGAPPAPGNYMGISLAVVSPAARGSITINSNDPLAAPLINPNILGTEIDLFFMRYALRSAFRFAASHALAGYISGPPFGLPANIDNVSDDDLNTFIRASTGSVFHPVGTAGVSPVGANYGVVDPDLTVKGLKGLRIVDLSVMPLIPAAHTQAAAYIIGERGADMIKESWL